MLQAPSSTCNHFRSVGLCQRLDGWPSPEADGARDLFQMNGVNVRLQRRISEPDAVNKQQIGGAGVVSATF